MTSSLSQEKFDRLIKRLERFAETKPALYKICVSLFAVLGYAYIILIIFVNFALLAALVWLGLNSQPTNAHAVKGGVQAFIFLLALALVLLRSLWISFPAPTGLELRRKDVPSLFQLVDGLSSKLKAPRFHRILLTDEFNACVIQRPRLGLFGWQQNYLIVGLSLMLALSPEQFRAVLAHELGHLSGNHNRLHGWIYRQRITWHQIFQRLKSDNKSTWFIFDWFFKWYMPFFNAYSFVLARMNEYEADKCSVELTGIQNTAEALINTELKSRFLQYCFWSHIYKQVETEVEPPATTFTNMKLALMKEIPIADASTFLVQALAEITNNQDTHPCLTQRLQALRYIPKNEEAIYLAKPIQVSAARELFGVNLEKYLDYFNKDWLERMATPWRQRYAYVQESLAKLKKLDINAEKQHLTTDESWERVQLTFEFKGEAAVLPLLQEILNSNIHHPAANYLLGQILLKRQDASGIEYIEKAIAQDQNILIEGCQKIYGFLLEQGKYEQAALYQKRAEEHYALLLEVQDERSYLRAKDELIPHNLPIAEIKNICQQLSGYPEVKAAYLVQKVVKHFPEQPLYILGVMRKVGFWGEVDSEGKNSQLLTRLLDKIDVGEGFIIILNNNPYMEKKIRKVPEALIYKSVAK